MWEFIVKNWGPCCMPQTKPDLVSLVVIILLSKTYAKREDLTGLAARVARVEQQLSDLPTEKKLHTLQLEISELRGELRALAPDCARPAVSPTCCWRNELSRYRP